MEKNICDIGIIEITSSSSSKNNPQDVINFTL